MIEHETVNYDDAYPQAAAYRIRGAQVWTWAEQDYRDGFSAAEICKRYDLGLSAFRTRARRDGWRRTDHADVAPAPSDFDDADDEGADAPRPQAADLAEAAWRAGARAIKRGQVYEARAWMRLSREMTAQAREEAREEARMAENADRLTPIAVSPDAAVKPVQSENVHYVHPEAGVHISPPPPRPAAMAAAPAPTFEAELDELDALEAEIAAMKPDDPLRADAYRAVAGVRDALRAVGICRYEKGDAETGVPFNSE